MRNNHIHPEEERTIIKIVETDKSQDDLFVAANIWLADTFVSAEAVIEYTDKEAGVLVGNGRSTWPEILTGTTSHYAYTIKIEIKGSRARIKLVATAASVGLATAGLSTQPLWDDRIRGDFEALAADFERSVIAEDDAF